MIAVSCLFEQLPAPAQQQLMKRTAQAAQSAAPQVAATLAKGAKKAGFIEKLFGSVPQGQEGVAAQLHPLGSAAQKINQALIRQLQQR